MSLLQFLTSKPDGRIPRGIARSGPAILSYGFRPFFLLAGCIAVVDMVLWVGALSGLWNVGGAEGPIFWHAHEMLFGYTAAALTGFVLTAVPNWTGRLPVSGTPLLLLVLAWLAGRIVESAFIPLPDTLVAVIDALFLPALGAIVAREVIVGRNWQNLRVAIGITAIGACNVWFHDAVHTGGDPMLPIRVTLAIYVMLVAHIGGRIVPSFTRNVLARRFQPTPRPKGDIDTLALGVTALALLAWALLPDNIGTAALLTVAAGAQIVRLVGWRGWSAADDHLLLVLHIGYAFVPAGLLVSAAAALGWLSPASALHVFTVGVIGLMTLAVMTRASRGHTGRPLRASWVTSIAYVAIAATALLRPLAELVPDAYHPLLALSAVTWIVGFGLFVAEHAPILLRRSARPGN